MPISDRRETENNELPDDLLKPALHEITGEYPVFRAGMDYRQAGKVIESGRGMLVEGSFPTALTFYSWLKNRITAANHARDYPSSRKTKQLIAEHTGKILVRVSGHTPVLEKAPPIPWLRSFYPDNPEFIISLPDLLGMNGAWQWYLKGIGYPGFSEKLHPFYGVYFPARTGHLTMFDQWLRGKRSMFSNAVDIGTGCGILGFIMAAHGIPEIHGTDINPNAVFSTRKEIKRLNLQHQFNVEKASFFGSVREVAGLAVFNPPWIPGKCTGITDMGIFYEETFYERFFNEAGNRLLPGATLVIIFSNFAIEAGIIRTNPVEEAAKSSEHFTIEEKIIQPARSKPANRPKGWMDKLREREKIELWVLKRSQGSRSG